MLADAAGLAAAELTGLAEFAGPADAAGPGTMVPAASVCGYHGRSGLSGAMSRDDVAHPAKPAAARIAIANEGLSRRMSREFLRCVLRCSVFELSEACIAEVQQSGARIVVVGCCIRYSCMGCDR